MLELPLCRTDTFPEPLQQLLPVVEEVEGFTAEFPSLFPVAGRLESVRF